MDRLISRILKEVEKVTTKQIGCLIKGLFMTVSSINL